jgi:hypothetical protein
LGFIESIHCTGAIGHLNGNNVDHDPPLTSNRDDGQTMRQWRARAVLKRIFDGDDKDMPRTSFCLKAAIMTAALATAAVAQAQVTPPAARPAPVASTEPSKASVAAKVEHWTRAQWEAAKKEWVKDTTKWANCQKQWNRYKREDRKNWPSIYKCMTS